MRKYITLAVLESLSMYAKITCLRYYYFRWYKNRFQIFWTISNAQFSFRSVREWPSNHFCINIQTKSNHRCNLLKDIVSIFASYDRSFTVLAVYLGTIIVDCFRSVVLHWFICRISACIHLIFHHLPYLFITWMLL